MFPRTMYRVLSALLLALLPLLAQGAEETLPVENAPAEKDIAAETDLAWSTTAFPGIETWTLRLTDPYPIAMSAVRIDLQASPRFFVTPQNGDTPKDTDSQTASGFMKAHGCQVVINGSFYSPVVREEGQPQDVLGYSVSNGDMYSKDQVDYDAVFISADNTFAFGKKPPEGMTVHNAVSGSNMILVDGETVTQGGPRHPRSSIGISKDRRYVYLVVRDGRQPEFSIGATLEDLADWMRRLGAHDALNLDGGGSSVLLIEGAGGEPVALNRPINLGIPGIQRANANHLGVFAGKE